MGRGNVPFLAFNRGLIAAEALGRVDLDRTKMSAAVMTNWLPKTQGAMRIRPGTKHFGSSLNDTGAQFIEFVASTDDVAFNEITNGKMRVWLGTDPHNLALLGRPKVDTTLTISDTGWSNTSTGGVVSTSATDAMPSMTGNVTGNVEVTASSFQGLGFPWRAADDLTTTQWEDTGKGSALPSWLNVDFDQPGTDTGNNQAISSYSIRAIDSALASTRSPKAWRLITGAHDTGTFATDTGKWTLVDERTAQTGWAVSEKRTFTRADADTGTVEAQRHWRLYFTQVDNAGSDTGILDVSELELFASSAAQQVKLFGGKRVFNASAEGSLAKLEKQVVVDTGDVGLEHSLAIDVERGPIILRTGSSAGNDDYISEATLGTGFHNLAFTPTGNFHVTIQSGAIIDRIVRSLGIGDSGTVEITAPWDATDLDNIRYDQSADVVYVDCDGVRPQKIERRGTGRSWSVVDYTPNLGPFKSAASSTAKLSVSQTFGNTTMNSDIPFFKSGHVGGLVRAFHNGQGGVWNLGQIDAVTDSIEVTGITDTGTAGGNRERRVVVAVTGTYAGTVVVQKSFDGEDVGFHNTDFSDTGTATHTFDDPDDNIKVYYRVKMVNYTSGAATVTITYTSGGKTGVARITGFNSNQDVDIEVLRRFSDTGPTESWAEGSWSTLRGFPTSVALHGGRLFHAGGAQVFGSVSDDFENFDDETVGDAAPIIKTLGSGPVDNVYYLVSLLRLIIGTTGSELTVRSSSIDEPLTPTNSNARAFSSQGSMSLRALKMDTDAIFIQRSKKKLFQIGFGEAEAFGDYGAQELTLFVPDVLKEGVVSIAIQRQPDTRIHCVLSDGTVAILTYEPQENVLAWSKFETNGSVERAMVLPGETEDAVYYHVNRTINGATKRFLEKWALETESIGDTGLSWLVDCATSYTDTGRATTADAWGHLVGASLVAWSDDTGQTNAGKDLSPDVAGVQTTYTVDTGGGISWTTPQHHVVAGLAYTADFKSTKLAYNAEAGTALAQMKRTDKIAFVCSNIHNNGLSFGTDTGDLDALPRVLDNGAVVDADKIFTEFDQAAMPFPGLWSPDSRIFLRAKAPRPCTVLAAVPTVETNEKI